MLFFNWTCLGYIFAYLGIIPIAEPGRTGFNEPPKVNGVWMAWFSWKYSSQIYIAPEHFGPKSHPKGNGPKKSFQLQSHPFSGALAWLLVSGIVFWGEVLSYPPTAAGGSSDVYRGVVHDQPRWKWLIRCPACQTSPLPTRTDGLMGCCEDGY